MPNFSRCALKRSSELAGVAIARVPPLQRCSCTCNHGSPNPACTSLVGFNKDSRGYTSHVEDQSLCYRTFVETERSSHAQETTSASQEQCTRNHGSLNPACTFLLVSNEDPCGLLCTRKSIVVVLSYVFWNWQDWPWQESHLCVAGIVHLKPRQPLPCMHISSSL